MRILFVDDTEDVRNVTKMVLESLGAQVVAVESGPLALEVFGDGSGLDLVLTDWEMPEMDGLRLAKEIKLRKPDVVVAITSGKAQSLTEEMLVDAGVTKVIPKPFKLSVLEALVA